MNTYEPIQQGKGVMIFARGSASIMVCLMISLERLILYIQNEEFTHVRVKMGSLSFTTKLAF
jgi:hypothetical protein